MKFRLTRFSAGCIAVLVLLPATLRAQGFGTVTFANNSSTKIINSLTGLPVAITDNVQVALYWAAAGYPNSFAQVGTNVPVGRPAPGIFASGTIAGPFDPNGFGQYQVRVWGGGYASYEQAAAAPGSPVGQSAVLHVAAGSPYADPPTPPGSLVAAGLQSITVPVPAYTPLTLIWPANKIVDCGAAWDFDAPTTRNGCGGVTITVLQTQTNGGCPRIVTRTWQATDFCGAIQTCSQSVTLRDTAPPTLVCAGDKTVECGSVWDFDRPIATDGCDGANVSLIVFNTVTNGACPLSITRTWLAIDACWNTNGCSQTVTVADTTPPVLTCAANKFVACGVAWDFDPPGVADNCAGKQVNVSVLFTVTNDSSPQSFTRTWLARDACGNTNTCSQTVTQLPPGLPRLTCATNRVVNCTNTWDFDPPVATDESGNVNLAVTVLDTVTNGLCPLVITRMWSVANPCVTNLVTCSQTVIVRCPDCPALLLTRTCPPNPVPSGGTLAWTGTVTNASELVMSNVVVRSDPSGPDTVAFGPVVLLPGAGASFSGSHSVSACSCGPHIGTLTVSGVAEGGVVFSNFVTTACAGTNVVVPGDTNGDGIVDQAELNVVLANYWMHSAWLCLTNAYPVGGGRFQFELTNASAWNFTVLVSSNMTDWTVLPGPACPVFQFLDSDATNAPQRLYRLRWP